MGFHEYKQVMNTLKQGRIADTLKKEKGEKKGLKAENKEKLEIPVGEGEKQGQLRPKIEKYRGRGMNEWRDLCRSGRGLREWLVSN